MSKRRNLNWLYFLTPLLIFLTAFFGGRVTQENMDWYQTINLPPWTPPGFLIGMVWTLIFILLFFAIILFLKKEKDKTRFWIVFLIFLFNLFLNFFWSYLFFKLHLIGWAVIEAFLLGISVFALIILIWPVSKKAPLLLLPYLFWTFFATFLTASVFLLN